MSWIFEHFQLIVVVAGVIAYWINQRGREKAGKQADYDGDGVPESHRETSRPEVRELVPASRDGSNPDNDERVRRIQEEIRRKIAERRGLAAPPSLPASGPAPYTPVLQETHRKSPTPVPVLVPASPRPQIDPYDEAASLERQRALADQLEKLEAKRLEARRLIQATSESGLAATAAHSAYAISPSTPATAVSTVGERRLAAELRDPRALRRAMVLREVLGAPVALR
ncbi:MAG: hypothetical protein RIQ79_1684 [Verrucomicrobiota bacterium]|jgi:hypothetical protein